MRVVLQRVKEANVSVDQQIVGAIQHGILILVGIEEADGEDDISWLVSKIAKLRIFADENDAMNKSVKDVDGDCLVVSQFTLHALTKKGNRPSFIRAARPDTAVPLYLKFVKRLENELGKSVATGEFGAMMDVSLTNDGPVTILIDSKNKE